MIEYYAMNGAFAGSMLFDALRGDERQVELGPPPSTVLPPTPPTPTITAPPSGGETPSDALRRLAVALERHPGRHWVLVYLFDDGSGSSLAALADLGPVHMELGQPTVRAAASHATIIAPGVVIGGVHLEGLPQGAGAGRSATKPKAVA